MDNNLELLKSINDKYANFESKTLPLCAAENAMSDFSKLPLASSIQEKYIMGGTLSLQVDHNFMESGILFEYYQLLTKLGKELYGANYTDGRTLTGMNALTTVLMSAFKIGDKVLLSSEDVGGHGSIPLICKRLGLDYDFLPYDFEAFDFDYDQINEMLKKEKISGIVIGLSDIQYTPQIEKIDLQNTILVYDATQTLGLIAYNPKANPLLTMPEENKILLLGATHKTIPGPSCGLIMARNISFAEEIDSKINPVYIRNVQMHQLLSLIYTLVEFQVYGKQYIEKIIDNTKTLSKLIEPNFNLIKKEDTYSLTHQIHFYLDPGKIDNFYQNASFHSVTLNKRTKKIYNYSGVRIGTQEITRYGYEADDLRLVSEVLNLLQENQTKLVNKRISDILRILTEKKTVNYCFR
ncbi:aminotransferase class I/II-fold pyridoxal phosphate-dependent enzyme [Enterococcus sp. AZ072]|uniref:aminotransferase class I/II-fold pyridoxal phosphate-dependent enzyme n=1 Tax=unclassified Enterococcus TaxID=2608891 RepID=UPI003D2CF9CB